MTLEEGCSMARPKKGDELGANSSIGVRVSAETKAALMKIAKRNSRDLSHEARFALEEHVRLCGERKKTKPARAEKS